MTYMRLTHGSRGNQSTDCTVCGPWCRWVESLAHPMCARTRTRANVNVRPRLLVKTNRHKTARREEETRIQQLTPAPHNTQYTAQPITTTHLTEATTNKETLCLCLRSFLLFTVGSFSGSKTSKRKLPTSTRHTTWSLKCQTFWRSSRKRTYGQ